MMNLAIPRKPGFFSSLLNLGSSLALRLTWIARTLTAISCAGGGLIQVAPRDALVASLPQNSLILVQLSPYGVVNYLTFPAGQTFYPPTIEKEIVQAYLAGGQYYILWQDPQSYVFTISVNKTLTVEGSTPIITNPAVPFFGAIATSVFTVSPNGSRVMYLAADATGTFSVVATQSHGQSAQTLLKFPSGIQAYDLISSPDGQRAFVIGQDNTLRVFNGTQLAQTVPIQVTSIFTSAVWTPDSSKIYIDQVVGGVNGVYSLIPGSSPQLLFSSPAQSFGVTDLVVSPDGRFLAGDDQSNVYVSELTGSNKQFLTVYTPPSDSQINCQFWTPNRQLTNSYYFSLLF